MNWTLFSNPTKFRGIRRHKEFNRSELDVARVVIYHDPRKDRTRWAVKVYEDDLPGPVVRRGFDDESEAREYADAWNSELIAARRERDENPSNPRPSKRQLQAAIHDMQVYLGANRSPTRRIRDTQRLYDRVRRKVDRIADKAGIPPDSAWSQIETEARSRGIISPMPGKDF